MLCTARRNCLGKGVCCGSVVRLWWPFCGGYLQLDHHPLNKPDQAPELRFALLVTGLFLNTAWLCCLSCSAAPRAAHVKCCKMPPHCSGLHAATPAVSRETMLLLITSMTQLLWVLEVRCRDSPCHQHCMLKVKSRNQAICTAGAGLRAAVGLSELGFKTA